jgi:hypothetical protein
MAGAATTAEIVNLAGTGGLIAVLIWAVRYLAKQWEVSQAKLVELLEKTIGRNTDALHDVRDVLSWCRGRHSGESEEDFKKRIGRNEGRP